MLDYLQKLSFEAIDNASNLIHDLVLSSLINQYSTDPHFDRRALECSGKGVGPGCIIIKLGMDRGEDVVGDADIEAIVHLVAGEGFEGVKVGLVGADDSGHGSE